MSWLHRLLFIIFSLSMVGPQDVAAHADAASPIGFAAILSQKSQESLDQQSYEWASAKGLSLRKYWGERWLSAVEWQRQSYRSDSGALAISTDRDLWMVLGRRVWVSDLRTALFIEVGAGVWTGRSRMSFLDAHSDRRLDREGTVLGGFGVSSDTRRPVGVEFWLRVGNRQWAELEPWMGLAVWGQWDFWGRKEYEQL